MVKVNVRRGITRPQPMDYATTRGMERALCARYGFLRPVALGQSVLGRELTGIVLSPAGDNVKDPQRVLVAGAFHGQEWLTALCTLRLCEELARALSLRRPLWGLSIPGAMQGRQIWFVPMVNPDGVEIALNGSASAGEQQLFVSVAGGNCPGRWQANARGVDINRNFDAGWEEAVCAARSLRCDRPGARYYPGTAPESEPETRALTELCRRVDFRHVVALHTQGEEIYWSYGEYTPPQSQLIARVLGAAADYAVATPSPEAAHGGFKDWFIRTFHRPGFTVELGLGENPLPLEDFEGIMEKAGEMLTLATLL